MGEISLQSSPFGGTLDATTVQPDPARLRERPSLGKISLRLSQATYANAESGLGLPLPAAGRAVQSAELTVLSVSPTEFLVVIQLGELNTWTVRLQHALAGRHAAVVDVSGSTTVLRLSGAAAPNLLYRGCPIELAGPAFPTGGCATTRIGRITTIVHRVDDEPCFDLYVPRSMAFSLLCWLTNVGTWHGLPGS